VQRGDLSARKVEYGNNTLLVMAAIGPSETSVRARTESGYWSTAVTIFSLRVPYGWPPTLQLLPTGTTSENVTSSRLAKCVALAILACARLADVAKPSRTRARC
jgi:hypothetical protein